MNTDLATIVDQHTVRLVRLLPGPIERVWDYLTKSEYLQTWLAAGDVEQRVGATVALNQDVPGVPFRSEHVFRGEVTRCEPPRVLAWTWDDQDGPPSEVTFELTPQGDQVMLTLTHTRIESTFMAEIGAGWHTHIAFMLAHMNGDEPVPFMDLFERLTPLYAEQIAAAG